MRLKRNDFIILGVAAIVLSAIFIAPADGAQITNAFARIFIDGVNVFNAKSYNDQLRFVSGSGISLSSSSPNTITITSTAGPGGDTNTAQIGDAGTHLSIFSSRFNATKNLLKTITCSGSAVCSTNTTDISISVSATGSTLKVDNQTVNRKQFMVGLNNATGDWTMRTFALNNVTVTSKVWPVGINNQTGVITTRTFALNNQTIQTGDYFVNGINNQTGVVTTKQFSVNTQSTTCSGSDKVSSVSINNATGAVTITCSAVTASGGATSLGANVTVTGSVSGDTLIWTIPLTANSGNTIDGIMTGTSSVSGTAIRGAANLTNVSSRGFCMWTQVSTTTANALDNLVLNTVLTGRATNTGETAWIAAANTALPIKFTCSIKTDATPGDLKIWATPELTGATQQIKAGSYYIKTP